MMLSNQPIQGVGARVIASILLLAGFAAVAGAQEAQSGAHSTNVPTGDSIERGAAELDDAFVSTEVGRYPAADVYSAADVGDPRDIAQTRTPAGTPLALWERLARLDEAQRANAEIALELNGAAEAAERDAAAAVAELWNRGAYEAALSELRVLEQAGAPLAAGIAWTEPVAAGSLLMADNRIGGTRDEAQAMNLDFHTVNGNVFAVVRWGSTTGTSVWTVNVSDDGGITWAETYSYNSSVGVIDVDCAVVDDYVYVAYVVGNATGEARLRRCLAGTGAIDSAYGFHVVFDAGAEAVEEVALASNANDYDNRIYYAIIQSNDELRFAYDVGSDGTTFVEDSPIGANPEFGLDMTWGNRRAACHEFAYISYSGNDGDIHVLGHGEGSWIDWTVEAGTGSFRTTAISAYQDAIICAFEYPYDRGTGIRYRISYDCGDGWAPGALAVPDGSTVFGYFEPDVDARDGHGTAITYQAEAGEFDPMYYRTRSGFAPGAWSDPAIFNDYDVYTGSDTALVHLPPVAGESFSHGALYLSLDPDFRTLYFDRPQAAAASCGDATPPTVRIDAPAALDCACDIVDITGAVADADGAYVGDRLEIRRRGTTSWTAVDTALGPRAGVLYTWDVSGLPQDYYYVRIVGENECGLTASDTAFVYVSPSFENIELRAPAEGGTYGGNVVCDGTATTPSCFAEYAVSYRPAGTGSWQPVDPFHPVYLSAVINDPLAYWNTVALGLPDGKYELRLAGSAACGATASATVTVAIDNTQPVARLDAPASCAVYAAGTPVAIRGEASDAHLSQWTLAVIGGPYADWHVIAGPQASNAAGLLDDWDTFGLPDCVYLIRLRASDQAVLGGGAAGHVTEDYAAIVLGDWVNADLDGDGDVDRDDFLIMVNCLAGPEVRTPPPGCDPADFAAADLDGDCDVDLRDFQKFQPRYTGP